MMTLGIAVVLSIVLIQLYYVLLLLWWVSEWHVTHVLISSLSLSLSVPPMIAHHSKPPATNVPLSHGTQTVTMDVTIDVGQDAIVAVGTTVNIRCNVTQVSNQSSCLIYTPLFVIG